MRRRLVIDQPIRRGSDRNKKRQVPAEPEVSLKDKAKELVDRGMPYQMAMAVVHGRMELNEALERLSRRDQVNVLMERHGLSRALATQVALGQVELGLILHRRRMKEHRAENQDRTVLTVGSTVALAQFGSTETRGEITEVKPYAVMVQPETGEPVEIHKLDVRYVYDVKEWKGVKRAAKKAKQRDEEARPASRPQDRYTCSDRRLFSYIDKKVEVNVTLLDGEVFRGVIRWFSRYEFGLVIKGDVEITVLRHALGELGAA